MAVPMENGVPAGPPTRLFELKRGEEYRREYDVAPDGRRFLVRENTEASASQSRINVLTTWFEELERLCPTGKK